MKKHLLLLAIVFGIGCANGQKKYDTVTLPGVPKCGFYGETRAEEDTCVDRWQRMVNYYTNTKGYRIIAELKDDWTIIIVPKGTPKYKP